MDEPGYLEKALKSIKIYIIAWFAAAGLALIGLFWVLSNYTSLGLVALTATLAAAWLLLAAVAGSIVAAQTSRPFEAIARSILHMSPTPLSVQPPDLERLTLAKELVANLVRLVYSYAARDNEVKQEFSNSAGISLQQLPIAVIGLDSEARITFANPKATQYSNASVSILGKDFYSLFDILFRDQTLQDWIGESEQNAVTSQKTWRGIRLNPFGEKTQYFDLAATYNKTIEKDKTQTIVTLFDQNAIYGAEEKGLSFIALAVHELRTPLTILRGYIEVFEDEVREGSLNPELTDFVRKMQVSSQNLASFVNNILNVAKIEENQLSLKLHEENWPQLLNKTIDELRLRAEVHGKNIELEIAPDLPAAGVDSVSISEVIVNLIDNAIKYSPPDKSSIKVSSYINKDGLIETVVQDFGVGVPSSVMPHLFEKFSRNYRNQNNIIGSGLGLYLAKALVTAHGGNIWVRSQEGQGSQFSFTLMPFSQLSEDDKNGVSQEITRSAHGWIKNHTLSRH